MIIGITGSIASGKSLVTNYLLNNGYKVIDSDKISHEVLLLEEVKEKLIINFGNSIIINNKIDRKQLAKIIFNNKEKKELLQSIVFPYILKEINNQIKVYEEEKVLFLDAPLLFEYNLLYLVDKIIVVYIDKNIQIERLMKRDNIDYDYANNKINSQIPLEEKIKYANFIINNNLDINNTINQINNILKQLEENK